MQTVDEYLAKNASSSQLKEYQRVDNLVMQLVPGAEKVISYGIPTWKYKGKYLIYFAAYKNHMSIYPVFHEVLEEMKDQLGSFVITKETLKSRGTLQFTEDNQVPEILIKRIVTDSVRRIEGKL
jgi:uncharacterized protein YdhG (YjbR/CyaY superfamily)